MSRVARLERLLAIAGLTDAVGGAESRADAARKLCCRLREVPGGSAAALFLEQDGEIECAASDGLALVPPAALLTSFEPPELFRIVQWARGAGFARTELAALTRDDRPFGLVALFGDGSADPLEPADLRRLGDTARAVLAHGASIEELRRAVEYHERTQDQLVRTERLRALGEMALGVAHDFNNVLNAILGQVGVLELLSNGRAELRPAIARLKHAALDGAETVGRLQDFSRQRRDRDFDELDFSEVVRAAAEGFGDGAGVAVACRIAPELRVAGHAAELRQVVDAILGNALEAMPGGGTVGIDLAPVDGEVVLTITDSGRGMSRDVRKRAFDPFFTTKGSLANGLGLSVAYGIVRRHGGRIELDSAPGHGTRVRVKLPALQPQPVEIPTESSGPVVLGAARILLVEDDADNRDAMAELLRLGGHVVTAAATGVEGVRRFAPDDFDLVVTDLGLPDMTGWDVAREVKELSSRTPVALVTGWGLNLASDEIRRRGVDLLIKKPIEPHKFLALLAQLAAYQIGPQ